MKIRGMGCVPYENSWHGLCAPYENSWHGLCARIQNLIVCRRSSRQCLARLIRLRSTLHPPPGSGEFASRILRAEHFHGENMKGKKAAILSANLFTLPGLHFDSAVLFIFLRQDESLDSPYLARSAKADAIMPFIP